jgi:hypothetical protein
MPAVRARRGTPFTAEERAGLVARFREAWQEKEAAGFRHDRDATEAARRAMAAAVAEYVDAVPIVALSRSPLSSKVFETSLDTFDLDGPWWAYEYEYRPYVEPPPDLFAWTGSLKVDGPLPGWTPLAMPGPDVPFVLPRILDQPGITAVISAVRVGPHVGFPVAYYADPQPPGLERADDWGHRLHQFLREDGTPTSAHQVEDDAEKDFDLRPWLVQEKLLWIAPADETLELHRGADGCPYVGLPGERRRRYLEDGKSWFA